MNDTATDIATTAEHPATTSNARAAQVRELARQLRALCPTGSLKLCVTDDEDIVFDIHQCPTCEAGTEILRDFGVGARAKRVFEAGDAPWSTVSGESENVHFTAFCRTLPPTCRLTRYVERIPKQETIDTGDYIEVERTKIECGAEGGAS